jgi:hypothetical protein
MQNVKVLRTMAELVEFQEFASASSQCLQPQESLEPAMKFSAANSNVW